MADSAQDAQAAKGEQAASHDRPDAQSQPHNPPKGGAADKGDDDTELKEEAEKAGIKPEALDDPETKEKVTKGQVDGKDGEGGEQDAAARLLQKRYRCVPPSAPDVCPRVTKTVC